ncbi:MFS transporter [Streptomyces orinoci]|uniref:MFS transporter n=1 Tax=Streptomyces orinoci TaxID=67339 RepID=A0ABV3JS77_STRON|nr:MFS transporter [Streptomyces orinoci]
MTLHDPAAPAARRTPAPQPAPHGWWPLVAITAALSMLMLDATVVVVALPDIRHELNTGLGDAQWVLNAFTLPLACCQLIAGFMGDRFGRRRTFAGGVLAFAAASLACGLAPDAGLLIAARGVQGGAAAAVFAVTPALIAQCYRGKARGTAFGIRGAVAGAVVVLSPLLGGTLVSVLGWRWIFFVNLPVSAAVLALTRLRMPADRPVRAGQRPDWGGLLTLSMGLLLLTLALLRGGDHGWCGTTSLLMFTGAAVALLAFLIVEARRADPMLDLSLFRGRTFTGTQLATLCTHGGFFGLLLYLSVYFQDHLGYSPMKTGLCFLTVNLPILAVSPVAGALMDRLPARLLPSAGLSLVATGLLLMHGLTPASGWRDLSPGLAVAGLGLGLTLPALGSLAVGGTDDRRLGMAAGVNTTASQAGMTLSTAVYGTLLQAHRDFLAGLDQLLLTAAAVTAAGAAAALLLITSAE